MAVYQKLSINELRARTEKAQSMLEACHICPRCCGINRSAGESGKCHVASEAINLAHQYGLYRLDKDSFHSLSRFI